MLKKILKFIKKLKYKNKNELKVEIIELNQPAMRINDNTIVKIDQNMRKVEGCAIVATIVDDYIKQRDEELLKILRS